MGRRLMSILLSILGAGKAIGGWLKSLPWQVYAILAGIAAILFLWHVHAGWEKVAHDAAYAEGVAAEKVSTDAEIAKNAINLASIVRLKAQIADQNRTISAAGRISSCARC